jgi:hypothetical protein
MEMVEVKTPHGVLSVRFGAGRYAPQDEPGELYVSAEELQLGRFRYRVRFDVQIHPDKRWNYSTSSLTGHRVGRAGGVSDGARDAFRDELMPVVLEWITGQSATRRMAQVHFYRAQADGAAGELRRLDTRRDELRTRIGALRVKAEHEQARAIAAEVPAC